MGMYVKAFWADHVIDTLGPGEHTGRQLRTGRCVSVLEHHKMLYTNSQFTCPISRFLTADDTGFLFSVPFLTLTAYFVHIPNS